VDDTNSYVAFSRAPFSRWVAAMAYPVDLVESPLRRSLAYTIGAGLALTGLTAAAAYAVGRRIARPIRAATGAAQALAHGEQRRVPPSAVREVHELAYALDRSAALLRRRETERATLLDEARAAHAEAEAANRAKDEFLATLSHELRSPLNAMMGWVRLLRSGRLGADRATHAIEVIDRNVSLQAQLINDLLDISRIVAGKLRLERRPTDVREAVRAAAEQVRTVAEDKGVALEVVTPPRPAMVDGDLARLVQIVGNLLSNAVKFTPAKGRVIVEVERARSEVGISVTDTGSGIAAEVLPHVFERFRQGESSGTRGLGLGLAIVRNLTELHGGRVHVTSDGEGRGARFVVWLPEMSVIRPVSAPVLAVPGPPRIEGQRVLLVEDEADHRELLETVMRGHRFDVVSVASGAEALTVWDRERFDLIVSDLRMPEVDGYDLIAEIRRRETNGGHVRAVAVSANAAQQDKERALAAGFDAHLSKPVDPDDLLAALV
jgi:signal transduction histidine kinase